jgi:opacity protein-like surface antigen
MLYAKAGWAGVRISARAVNVTNGEFADFTTWSNGWTAGVGMEYVPWQNIVVGVEADVYGGLTFDHSGVDNFNVPFRFFNTDATIWAITVRASYLFGPTIVTRYVN